MSMRRLGEKAHELSSRSIEVTVHGVSDLQRTFTLGELGIVLDVARTSSLVHEVGHQGAHATRFLESRRASEGKIDIPILVNLDEELARSSIAPLKDATDEFPVPARLDLANGGIIAEQPGDFLDVDRAFEQIREAALSGATKIDLERLDLVPKVSREYLEKIRSRRRAIAVYHLVLAQGRPREPRAQHRHGGRAARRGGVAPARALLVQRSGRASHRGERLLQGLGNLQRRDGGGDRRRNVSGRQHLPRRGLSRWSRHHRATPAFATERLHHDGARRDGGVPGGRSQDAQPLRLPGGRAQPRRRRTVVFELLGRERPAKVVFGREVLAVRPFTRKIEEMPGLAANRIIRKQHGIRGYKILRTRTIAVPRRHRAQRIERRRVPSDRRRCTWLPPEPTSDAALPAARRARGWLCLGVGTVPSRAGRFVIGSRAGSGSPASPVAALAAPLAPPIARPRSRESGGPGVHAPHASSSTPRPRGHRFGKVALQPLRHLLFFFLGALPRRRSSPELAAPPAAPPGAEH